MNSLYDLRKKLDTIKAQLTELVETLPDCADGVQLLPGNNRCGVVSFSTIGKNDGILAPSYYLTREIKQEMLDRISRGTIDSVINLVEKMIQSGSLPADGSGHRPLRLPPNFIARLREIWNHA